MPKIFGIRWRALDPAARTPSPSSAAEFVRALPTSAT
jgi:hypothetical protein